MHQTIITESNPKHDILNNHAQNQQHNMSFIHTNQIPQCHRYTTSHTPDTHRINNHLFRNPTHFPINFKLQ